MQCPIFICPLPLDLPLAAAAPEAGFSSCLSPEKKCFSRCFCWRCSMWTVLALVWSVVLLVLSHPTASLQKLAPVYCGVQPGPTGVSSCPGRHHDRAPARVNACVCCVVVAVADAPCGHCSNVGDGCSYVIPPTHNPRPIPQLWVGRLKDSTTSCQ